MFVDKTVCLHNTKDDCVSAPESLWEKMTGNETDHISLWFIWWYGMCRRHLDNITKIINRIIAWGIVGDCPGRNNLDGAGYPEHISW